MLPARSRQFERVRQREPMQSLGRLERPLFGVFERRFEQGAHVLLK